MLPVLHIGPLAIQLPGLILLLGLWLGLSLAEKHAHRHGIRSNHIFTFAITAIIAGTLGARLVYALRFITAFLNKPGDLLSLNPELLDPIGAVLGAALIVIYFIRHHKLNPWALYDALTPALAVLAVAIHLANLASGRGFGAPTNLPWAIFLRGEWRHPTQIYEMIAALILLGYFWPSNARTHYQKTGLYGISFLATTAVMYLFFGAFHGDSVTIPGGFRSSQVIAWLVLATSLWLFSKRKPNAPGTEKEISNG